MKLLKCMILLICVSSCAGERYLVLGEQICPNWNGIYFEALSGTAKLNVGEKEVQIQGVTGIPNNTYQLNEVIQQNSTLKVWLTQNNQYIAMQMSRDNISDKQTAVFFTLPASTKGSFPSAFDIPLNMIRQ